MQPEFLETLSHQCVVWGWVISGHVREPTGPGARPSAPTGMCHLQQVSGSLLPCPDLLPESLWLKALLEATEVRLEPSLENP